MREPSSNEGDIPSERATQHALYSPAPWRIGKHASWSGQTPGRAGHPAPPAPRPRPSYSSAVWKGTQTPLKSPAMVSTGIGMGVWEGLKPTLMPQRGLSPQGPPRPGQAIKTPHSPPSPLISFLLAISHYSLAPSQPRLVHEVRQGVMARLSTPLPRRSTRFSPDFHPSFAVKKRRSLRLRESPAGAPPSLAIPHDRSPLCPSPPPPSTVACASKPARGTSSSRMTLSPLPTQ